MIYFNNNYLSSYTLITDGSAQADSAKSIFSFYIQKICNTQDVKENLTIKFICNTNDEEYFNVKSENNSIVFSGGKRGIIYGVYEFLEKKCQFLFLKNDCIIEPKKDIYLKKINLESNSIIKFREILGNDADLMDDMLKLRTNSNAWRKRLTDEVGGGITFAGVPAHSLTSDFLLKPYVESNPEYFCLRNGIRECDRFAQACFSAKGLVDSVIKEVFALLEKNPNAKYVSVSQADSDHYCECEECKKKYEEYSKVELFLQIVNQVADAIKDKYPNVLVHTFAYNKTCEPPKKVKPKDNVVIQYCIGSCKNHPFFDKRCKTNKVARQNFEEWTRNYKNVIIWDYINCFKVQMYSLPDLNKYRKQYKYFALHNVNGVFCEGVHRLGDNSCAFMELKSYVIAKLLWNPYMSECEYRKHINEFIGGYYEDAGKYIKEYLYLYERCINKKEHYNYDLQKSYSTFDKNQKFEFTTDLIKNKKFFEKAYKLWDKAFSVASDTVKERLNKEYLQLVYLDNWCNFDNIMASGTEEEKQIALNKNKMLYDGIIKYNIKLTFWGCFVSDQIKEMKEKEYYKLSPREWNYRWN